MTSPLSQVIKPRYRVPALQVHSVPALRAGITDTVSNNNSSGLEAGRYSRRLSSFLPSRQHVNSLISNSGGTITARSRFLVRNNGYASCATEEFASAAVGYGITPNWQHTNSALVKAGMKLFKKWITEADSEGLTDFYGMMRRMARELFIAGEVFFRTRFRYRSDGLSVPLQYQMLPSEMLDPSYNEDLGNGNTIRQGIEFNRIGKRIAYHFWRVHPEDMTTVGDRGRGQRTRVPAEEIMHILDPVEAGQIRGLSKLAPAIVKIWSLDQYDDAELERKKTAALFTGFITRPDPEGKMFDEEEETNAADSDGIADIALEPGTMHTLAIGEDVKFTDPPESGTSYEPFQYRTILQLCVALGIPYFTLAGDLVKANYSSARVGLINFRRRIEALQYSVIIQSFCRPVWRTWLEQAILAGAIDISDYNEDPDPYLNVEWIPPAWEWVDPKKDIEAEILAIDNRLQSRSAAIKGRGLNPEDVDEEIARDMAREKELGIEKVVKAPAVPKANPPVDDKEDEDEK